MSKFHNYSFNNTLLIAMQKPEATLVAGYQAWQKNCSKYGQLVLANRRSEKQKGKRKCCNSHKADEFQLLSGGSYKVPIDLVGISGYNGIEIIHLLGMAFAFPIMIKGGLWLMDTEMKNAVSATDQDAQYDDKAKRLLGNKIILAHILVKT